MAEPEQVGGVGQGEAGRGVAYYQLLFDRAYDAIFIWAAAPDGRPERLLDVNASAGRLLGCDSPGLLDASSSLTIAVLAELGGRDAASPHVVFESELPTASGGRVPCEISSHRFELAGRPVGMSIARDLSERRRADSQRARLEAQLRHSQKIEAVGRLAGGIAHDFNNLLTVILQYASILLDELRPGDPMRGDIEQIEKAGKRAAALTQQLLAFSRKSPIAPEVLDLDALVGEMHAMLGRIVGEDIELVTDLDGAPWLIEADRGHVEQVVANLVVNARDAMPKGGRLLIRTERVSQGEGRTGVPGLSAGDHLVLSVIDGGLGMTDEVKQHLFEPFFTTKKEGKGTGLGLATVYGIVKQAGGDVLVESTLGEGSSFHVYLPRTERAHTEMRTPTRPTRRLERDATILVVEDEDAVRGIARRTLERDGHRVLEARSGGEALLAVERHPGEIDLLVTDVVMPGMSGPELARRLRGTNPAMQVVFVSGHAEEVLDEHGLVRDDALLVQKPFTRDTLGIAVQEALSRRHRDAGA